MNAKRLKAAKTSIERTLKRFAVPASPALLYALGCELVELSDLIEADKEAQIRSLQSSANKHQKQAEFYRTCLAAFVALQKEKAKLVNAYKPSSGAMRAHSIKAQEVWASAFQAIDNPHFIDSEPQHPLTRQP